MTPSLNNLEPEDYPRVQLLFRSIVEKSVFACALVGPSHELRWRMRVGKATNQGGQHMNAKCWLSVAASASVSAMAMGLWALPAQAVRQAWG